MSTKIFNQKGFTAFEGVLIAIILALIAGVGYYVFQTRTESTSDNKTVEVEKKDPYQGWNTFESAVEKGVTFKYPNSWQVETIENKNQFGQDVVSLKTKNGYKFSFSTPVDGLGGACFDRDKDPNNAAGLTECPLYKFSKIGSTKVDGVGVYKRTWTSDQISKSTMVIAGKTELESLDNKRTIGLPGVIGEPVCNAGCIFQVDYPEKYYGDPISSIEGKQALLILESIDKN